MVANAGESDWFTTIQRGASRGLPESIRAQYLVPLDGHE